jgi:outer membrane protein OmpA-like peptidoglycan-associated protein
MSLRSALLASSLLALPLFLPSIAQAQPQPLSGVYIGGGAGVNFMQDADLDAQGRLGNTLRGRGVSRNGTLKTDTGGVGVLSIGYGFGNGVRAEFEGNFRANKVDGFSGLSPLGGWGLSRGSVSSYGAMANAFYDFHTLGLPVTPYIGAGIGYAFTDFDKVRATSRVTGERLAIDDTDGQFAYQAMLGASLPVSFVPGLLLTAEYRFFGTLDNEVKTTLWQKNGTPPQRGRTEVENLNHSFLLGLRYAFNAPAPAVAVPVAAPAASPVTARSYLVFFNFDAADLTERARQIIAEAAQGSAGSQTTRIEVAGHADRSGTTQYNQRLSQRRADVVAAELVRLGVARSAITVQAFGESRPLVATADGVRDPQNRRVEIILR